MSREDRKRREVELGLANNAFGAAAGTVATVQARNAWKRAAKHGKMPRGRVGRVLARTRISPGKAIMAAGALNVAGQAANGLLDAQSAQYFARERMSMPKKPKTAVTKGATMHRIEDAGNGSGHRIIEPVSKLGQLPGTEAHSQTRRSTQAAYLGGLGAMAGGLAVESGARQLARRNWKAGKPMGNRVMQAARLGRATKIGGLGVAAATGVPLLAYAGRDIKQLRQRDLAAYKRQTGKDYPGMRAVRRELKEKERVGKAGNAAKWASRVTPRAALNAYHGGAGAQTGYAEGVVRRSVQAQAGRSGPAGRSAGRSVKTERLGQIRRFGGRQSPKDLQDAFGHSVTSGARSQRFASLDRAGAARRSGDLQGARANIDSIRGRRTIAQAETAGVFKARRFDAEADRQRRLGAYAGLAAGGALVVGDRAARELDTSVKRGTIVDRATGKRKAVATRHVGFKPGRGRIGAGLAAGATGLAALSAASYKRGVSERNQPWA